MLLEIALLTLVIFVSVIAWAIIDARQEQALLRQIEEEYEKK